jgi:separase
MSLQDWRQEGVLSLALSLHHLLTTLYQIQLAYEAFVEAVRTFPYTHYPIPSVDLFAPASPLPLKQLASIVERLTYTGTCELFLPPGQVTLRHVFQTPDESSNSDTNSDKALTFQLTTTMPTDTRLQAEITASILSRQLNTLEGITHKEGVREALWAILQDLLAIYDASWAPVQRAGVVVTSLSVSWRDGGTSGDEQIGLDAERMGREALELLAREVGVPTFCLSSACVQVTPLIPADRLYP